MVQLNTLTSTMNSFSFDLTTSSGDTISLSIYDNKSLAYESFESEGSSGFSMSLKHEFGYSFSYRGDGIDAQDMKEIEKAMKEIKPLFQKFMENVRETDRMPGVKELTNLSQKIRSKMPKLESPDALDMLKERSVDTIDELLKTFERNDKVLNASKRLFDRVFERLDGLELYV